MLFNKEKSIFIKIVCMEHCNSVFMSLHLVVSGKKSQVVFICLINLSKKKKTEANGC